MRLAACPAGAGRMLAPRVACSPGLRAPHRAVPAGHCSAQHPSSAACRGKIILRDESEEQKHFEKYLSFFR